MFSGICQTCVGPFFRVSADNETVVEAEWEVGETRFGLRKCLEVEVRARKSW
jgi:tubulin---tyrosine ligase